MLRKQLHEENRLSWNVATQAHNSHKKDQVAFFRSGGSTLFPEEISLLGDIREQTMVHLQCNAGQDTLSLAQLGAQVTGVDISDTAIDFARCLSEEAAIAATFHRADIYDWLDLANQLTNRYDIAFSSYGALVWLSDLKRWASGIAGILKPGGRLILVEFHPFAMVFDYDWSLRYPYFCSGEPITWDDGVGDYVALSGEHLAPSGYLEGIQDFRNPYRAHEFQWSMSDIISSVIGTGLTITSFNEYPYMNGAMLFEGMRERPGSRMFPPEQLPTLPLMFGLSARKDQ